MTAPVLPNKRRTPAWAIVLLVLVLAGAVGYAGLTAGRFLGAREERQVQVIRSVQGEEQIILVTAGITDVAERSAEQDFFGLFTIPFSERTMFLRYDFDAKFGIDGRQVAIEPLGEDTYRISVPEFEFLGYDDPEFSIATESNGILSWTTPTIDVLAEVEGLLTDEAVAEHIEGLRPVLEQQAATFYSRIVTSIEPEATLVFDFADSASGIGE